MATAVAGVDMPLVVPCNQGTCGERLRFVGRSSYRSDSAKGRQEEGFCLRE